MLHPSGLQFGLSIGLLLLSNEEFSKYKYLRQPNLHTVVHQSFDLIGIFDRLDVNFNQKFNEKKCQMNIQIDYNQTNSKLNTVGKLRRELLLCVCYSHSTQPIKIY